MTTTTNTHRAPLASAEPRSPTRLSLSRDRIHFASTPRAGDRPSLRLRLTGALVGRR